MKIQHLLVGVYLLSQVQAQTEDCKIYKHSLRAVSFAGITAIVLFTMCIIMLTIDLACHYVRCKRNQHRLSPPPEGGEAPPPYMEAMLTATPPPPYHEPIMMEEL